MNKSLLLLSISAFTAGLIEIGCNTPDQKAENAENKVVQANDDLDKANQEYLADIEKCRKETADKATSNDKYIAELKAGANNVKTDAKDDYNKTVAELEQKNREMKKKMDDYKPEGKDKWALFKTDFNTGMDELGKSIKDVFARNNKQVPS
jgi:hypothetical protein